MIPKWISHIKLFFLIIGVVIFGSAGNILTPIIVGENSTSTYFILLLNGVESFIMYFIFLLGIMCWKASFHVFKIKLQLLLLTAFSGIISGLIGVCFLYASNPTRTPIIMQSILLGVSILPNVIFTKFILQKQNQYNFKYIITSICFLLISIGFGIIPLLNIENKFDPKMIGWIVMYLLGVILFSLYSILQEKFIIETNDNFENKIKFAFYSGFFQLITIINLFWIDILFDSGNINNFLTNFISGAKFAFANNLSALLLQLFIFDCVIFFIISIYLNEISSNYNMILSGLTNQSVILFFIIFPKLNTGIEYSIYISVFCIVCNISSVLCWLKGESTLRKKYTELNRTEINISEDDFINT